MEGLYWHDIFDPSFFTTGVLIIAIPLDHEIQDYYNLTIMALDDGTPALSATQIVTIMILDVNDERPQFQRQLYEAIVCENKDPGEFVIKVEAVDRDSGNLLYITLNKFRELVGRIP